MDPQWKALFFLFLSRANLTDRECVLVSACTLKPKKTSTTPASCAEHRIGPLEDRLETKRGVVVVVVCSSNPSSDARSFGA
jgi:hypothetical protein